jgi:hypothetical protein
VIFKKIGNNPGLYVLETAAGFKDEPLVWGKLDVVKKKKKKKL